MSISEDNTIEIRGEKALETAVDVLVRAVMTEDEWNPVQDEKTGLRLQKYRRLYRWVVQKKAMGCTDLETLAKACLLGAFEAGLELPYDDIRRIAEEISDSITISDAQKLVVDYAKEDDPKFWFNDFTPLSSWQIPEPVAIVDELLIEYAITVFAGLFESYKSMAALELCAAIRQGRPAFDHFAVRSKHEVLYLCLDMSPGAFLRYASFFGLHQDEGVRGIDPKVDVFIGVDSEHLQAAVKDRVLVLDTMLDYAGIKEANQSSEWIAFFSKLRQLITVHGCKAILLIAHPTKSGARSAKIDVTEYLKDSVTFGGKVDLAFAFRKLENNSDVWVERVKQGRFYEAPIKFTASPRDEHGNSNLSNGRFPVHEKPEELQGQKVEARMSKTGPKPKAEAEWVDRAIELQRAGMGTRGIAKELGVTKGKVEYALNRRTADMMFAGAEEE